jgi:membrane-associated phospholipid phosphatase
MGGNRLLIAFIFLLIGSSTCYSMRPVASKEAVDKPTSTLLFTPENSFAFQKDSLHRIDFRYADRQRGIKPLIAPVILITGGTFIHFMPGITEGTCDYMQKNMAYNGHIDDYGKYAPLAAVYLLNLAGVKGKNNFGNRSVIALKSILLSSTITYKIKVWVNETRPNGGVHSFPSGHTASAFTFAQFMHREYGDRHPLYSVGAYSGAAAVGIMRMAKNAHWVSDVLLGAGIGMLSTELVYLTHQYKWDNAHLKRLDIFPFQLGNQKGVSLVYTF